VSKQDVKKYSFLLEQMLPFGVQKLRTPIEVIIILVRLGQAQGRRNDCGNFRTLTDKASQLQPEIAGGENRP
jgi:hypothetical protein